MLDNGHSSARSAWTNTLRIIMSKTQLSLWLTPKRACSVHFCYAQCDVGVVSYYDRRSHLHVAIPDQQECIRHTLLVSSNDNVLEQTK